MEDFKGSDHGERRPRIAGREEVAMYFIPPAMEETEYALGSTAGFSPRMRRALLPGSAFEPIPRPAPGDWLAEHHEPGQSYEQFRREAPASPAGRGEIIFLQPLGSFPEGKGPPIDLLGKYAESYFCVPARILPPRPVDDLPVGTRLGPRTARRQLLTRDILTLLMARFPSGARCVLALTMEDLYPAPSWNFVFGEASPGGRVGVLGFARYDPGFYGEKGGEGDRKLLLRRSLGVLAHETAHMLSLRPCIFYRCVMNGSNHLAESDTRPLAMCPICLRKLHHATGLDVVERYRALLSFYTAADLRREAEWVSARLEAISGPEK
jgi:archaemetzincin